MNVRVCGTRSALSLTQHFLYKKRWSSYQRRNWALCNCNPGVYAFPFSEPTVCKIDVQERLFHLRSRLDGLCIDRFQGYRNFMLCVHCVMVRCMDPRYLNETDRPGLYKTEPPSGQAPNPSRFNIVFVLPLFSTFLTF